MKAVRQYRVDVRGPLELTVQLGESVGAGEGELAGQPDTSLKAASAFVDRLPDASGGASDRFEVVVDGWRFEVSVEPARHAQLRERAARIADELGASASVTLRAQIPGRVTRIWVAPGEAVEQGQRLLAVEAMKMENEVRAPRGGSVAAVHVEAGATVERDDELVTLA